MHVDEADVVDDVWRATQIVGSLVERSNAQLGCVGTRVRYSFTASLLPDYADALVRVENFACGVEGSGFIVDGRLVVTNAHVVAGADEPAIVERGRLIRADVVAFEPKEDIAILSVRGLNGGSLHTSADEVDRGTDVVVLGYPGERSLTAADATIKRVLLYGTNIFNRPVRLDGYAFRGFAEGVGPGSSGGPLVTPTGEVVGIVAGGSQNLGLAIASTELVPILRHVQDEPTSVGTGGCLH
jgi:S1-C subfamily serine protease